jgi:REP element-mobilizing transposase RayT
VKPRVPGERAGTNANNHTDSDPFAPGRGAGDFMPQSLAKLYVHLIFSTKNREPLLTDAVRAGLHAYMGGILRDLDSPAVEVNSEPDHVHILFILSQTHALSDAVGQLKRGSSAWLKTKGAAFGGFHWQTGYGAYSVSQSGVEEVRGYI